MKKIKISIILLALLVSAVSFWSCVKEDKSVTELSLSTQSRVIKNGEVNATPSPTKQCCPWKVSGNSTAARVQLKYRDCTSNCEYVEFILSKNAREISICSYEISSPVTLSIRNDTNATIDGSQTLTPLFDIPGWYSPITIPYSVPAGTTKTYNVPTLVICGKKLLSDG